MILGYNMAGLICVVIPVHNRKDQIMRCVKYLKMQTFKDFNIAICDDGSTDGTSEAIKSEYPDVYLLKGDGNYWWSKSVNTCVNFALKDLGVKFILTLNDDLIVEKEYIGDLLKCAREHPRAIIGSLAVDINNPSLVIDSGLIWNKWLAKYHFNTKRYGYAIEKYNGVLETSMLSGRGTLIPCEVFRDIGLYDSSHMPQYAADQDFSLRAVRKNYELFICCSAIVKSEKEKTGLGLAYKAPNLKIFVLSIFSIKSPNWLKSRFYFIWKNVPKLYLPIYLVIDYLRIVGSFSRRYMAYKLGRG
jgi:GT2 family glycosyltransferase